VLTEGRRVRPRVAWALMAAGGLLVWAYARGSLAWPLEDVTRELPAAVGFAAICAACASPSAPRLLSRRPVLALGTLSFGVYLWHYPIIMGLQRGGLWPEHFPITLTLVSALSLAAAWLSWQLVERPVLRAVQRRVDGAGRGHARPRRNTLARPRPALARAD
jgi:peptidoglycan/LPS O-acetylase OafA/YrhL